MFKSAGAAPGPRPFSRPLRLNRKDPEMSVRPYRDISRRKSRQIRVGSVLVGGDAPISVQTMTNTLTADAAATIEQIRLVEEAGADIVRVSCPDEESTAALPQIVRAAKIPIVAGSFETAENAVFRH